MNLLPNAIAVVLIIGSAFQSISQTLTNKIVIDQFGYRPDASKVAVIRNPITGDDAAETYTPGTTFQIINVANSAIEFSGGLSIWNGGNEDASSGDKAWWFDFSTFTNEGSYYVLDLDNNTKSFEFEIKEDVYNEVLKHAVRAFFYQRSGFAKESQYAGASWADGASHIGALQDKNCRAWDAPTDAGTELDVHGGWYDAGDFNKYTIWTANYVVDLLRAYEENPDVWLDDYNIPESGNGIPDVIDETKWGMDHLIRLQKADGSCIAIVDAAHASPPSAGTEQSLYGNVNTSSTLAAGAAFAFGSIIFESLGMTTYANDLKANAIKAWDWADANPSVVWKNNDAASGTSGIGAGQQERDDYGRLSLKLRLASFLFEVTGEAKYKTYFEANYTDIHMLQWNFSYPFEDEEQDILLRYAELPNVTSGVASAIQSTFTTSMEKEHNFQALDDETDPYRAHMDAYTWGSNKQKCSQGLMYWEFDYYNLNSSKSEQALIGSEDYIHYMHGVNPLNLVYLTNMSAYGAENSVNQIYHNWFAEGTDWDDAANSLYGPAPGIVPGGPNPAYKIDACCPSGCGSPSNNAKCTAVDVSGLSTAPKQKAYVDFNNSWPLNSWEITENSMGYQIEYIRLLSKFVAKPGNVTTNSVAVKSTLSLFPNPTNGIVRVKNAEGPLYVNDVSGKLIFVAENNALLDISQLAAGVYWVKNTNGIVKLIKK